MTTLPAPLQWLKPPGYRYEPGPQTPAQRSAQQAYERARPTPATQPQSVNPQQAGQVLGAQGQALVDAALGAAQKGGQIAIDNKRGLNEVEGNARQRLERMLSDSYRTNTGTYVEGRNQLGDAEFGRGLQMARELRGMGADTGQLVAGAVTGEQDNDRMKLEILREALKPSLVDNISGIAGAIAPLLAVFAA
jgi:hypothetical protein